jgi:hypothetical protein
MRTVAKEAKIFTVASLEPADRYWRNQISNLGSMVQSRVYYSSIEWQVAGKLSSPNSSEISLI